MITTAIFLTNDEKGDLILHFLINPNLIDELNEILMKDFSSDLEPFFGSDTVTEDGMPVIFAYCCDLRKIRGFVSMLAFHERKGIIICFDFQKEALQKYGGEYVEIKTLD